MTGSCSYCHVRAIALPGVMSRRSRARPPTGFKVGYVIENATKAWLVCTDCLHNTLLAAA